MTERTTAEDGFTDEEVAREKMLKHLPKLYELLIDIPGTHREKMFDILIMLTEGLP